MASNYISSGDSFSWSNAGTAVVSGQVVVVGKIICVAMVDIANGESGTVRCRGIFTVPKVSGAVIAHGENLTWDASAAAFDDNAATPASGDVTGAPAVAMEAAGNGVTSFDVMLTGVPGTVA